MLVARNCWALVTAARNEKGGNLASLRRREHEKERTEKEKDNKKETERTRGRNDKRNSESKDRDMRRGKRNMRTSMAFRIAEPFVESYSTPTAPSS